MIIVIEGYLLQQNQYCLFVCLSILLLSILFVYSLSTNLRLSQIGLTFIFVSGRLLVRESLLEEKAVFQNNSFGKCRFPYSTTDITLSGKMYLSA